MKQIFMNSMFIIRKVKKKSRKPSHCFTYIFFIFLLQMISPNNVAKFERNPWAIQSIYELQFFNCPSCEFKDFSKQEFINHAHVSHFEAVSHLTNIKDGSLDDITCPWNHQYQFTELLCKTEPKNDIVLVDSKKVQVFDENQEEGHENIFDIHDEEEEWMDSNETETNDFMDENNSKNDSLLFGDLKTKHIKPIVKLEQIKYSTCDHCHKLFENRSFLRKHMRKYHEDIKIYGSKETFKCETCETVFTDISSLKRHKRIVHENKKYHNCDFCGKSFSKKHDLKRHIQYSHDSDFDMNNVKCSECTETFAKKSQLNHHLLIGKWKYIKFD